MDKIIRMISLDRYGVDEWLSDKASPSIIGLCLDFGVDPGKLSDLVDDPEYEWLKYAVWRIMAAAESRLFQSVTGLRDMLVRCERVVGGSSQTTPSSASDDLDRWISAG